MSSVDGPSSTAADRRVVGDATSKQEFADGPTRADPSFWRSASFDRLLSVVLLVALGVSVEWLVNSGSVSPLIVPRPSTVLKDLWNGLANGVYIDGFISTIWGTIGGFLISAAAAITLGSVLALAKRLERVLSPYIIAFQSLPKIAIAPLVLIWFGFGFQSKLLIVVAVSFFPIFINTMHGLRVRDRERWELVSSLGASRWQLFRYIRLPSALPFIWTGLRIGAIFSLIGAVVAELLGVTSGLGYLLVVYKASFRTASVFAVLILLVVVGLALELATRWLGDKLVFWDKEISDRG